MTFGQYPFIRVGSAVLKADEINGYRKVRDEVTGEFYVNIWMKGDPNAVEVRGIAAENFITLMEPMVFNLNKELKFDKGE